MTYSLLTFMALAISAISSSILEPKIWFSNSANEEKANIVDRIQIGIAMDQAIHVTSDKYLSVVMGPTTIKQNWSTFDMSSPRLRTLATALSPCVLRLGGTGADFVLFNSSAEATEEVQMDDSGEGASQDPFLTYDTYTGSQFKNMTNFTMTAKQWDQLNGFVKMVGWELLFDLNVLLRDGERWDPRNAAELLAYSIERNYTNHLHFELGNEPNAFEHALNRSVPAAQLGRDFLTLAYMMRQQPHFAPYYRHRLLVGPDVTKPKVKLENEDSRYYMKEFLAVAGKALDVITWHQYYMDGRIATAADFRNPDILDLFLKEALIIKDVIQKAGLSRTPLWLGETGSCWGGGAPNLSNRFAGGFFWLDKLGLAAVLGHDTILRQTFYEGQYGLIDKELFPNPDYWLSIIYRTLVGRQVLKVVRVDSDRGLRVYAHCSNAERSGYPKGAVTIYALNLKDEAAKMTLTSELQSQDKLMFWFTPHGRHGPHAKFVNVNGQKMALVDDTTLPRVSPRLLPPGPTITLPPASYGFVVLPQARARACL